ncbi:hypothetical protein [Hymenobacter chitinivorans]|uniref:Uncharacterized protein n=1 Tax=Hymenobacter chitinivorans DSM 11115 TaxID=1121954 RepID=A0A2M9B9A4_9BACT|nr:hypothetical protein [Hymenobacter chitinivorans]PJJ54523.1 hypothetical protein CLV45_2864 [Hymenobacter chitinivorans DSM 11115]
MKKLIAALLLAGTSLVAFQAQAQSSEPAADKPAASRKPSRKASGEDIARMQRRMSMNPNEVKRDQQMEILEARSGGTANTSFGRAAGPARQYEKGNSGFMVRKFKDKRGTAQQKRGQSRPAPGIDPKGKPLSHKKKHRFLFF